MFVGIITRSTEFVVMSPEGLYKCTRMQKAPDDSAYDPQCIEYAKYMVEQYISAGAKSAEVRVRMPIDNTGLVLSADVPTAGGSFDAN